MKYCRVIRMSSPNNPCSQDNLERVIDMQHCNPLIHQQFTESKIQVVMAECSHLRATRQIQQLFQAVVQQNVRELQALGRRAEKYGPATIREAQIAVPEVLGRLHFNTAAFCGWYEARATGRHLQKRWKTDLVFLMQQPFVLRFVFS